MIPRATLGLILILLVAFSAGFVLRMGMTGSDSSVVLPLQNRVENPDQTRTDQVHLALQEHLKDMEINNLGDGNQNLKVLETAYQDLMRMADSTSDSDLDATGAFIIKRLVEHYQRKGQLGEASRVCLEFRWHSIRLNRFADICSRLVGQAPATPGSQKAKRLDRSFVFINPPSSIRRLLLEYKRNPYDSDVLFRLASELAREGYLEPARALGSELLQLDPLSAARLESEIARGAGIEHIGHAFEFEDDQ